jgi:hypothetical protein
MDLADWAREPNINLQDQEVEGWHKSQALYHLSNFSCLRQLRPWPWSWLVSRCLIGEWNEGQTKEKAKSISQKVNREASTRDFYLSSYMLTWSSSTPGPRNHSLQSYQIARKLWRHFYQATAKSNERVAFRTEVVVERKILGMVAKQWILETGMGYLPPSSKVKAFLFWHFRITISFIHISWSVNKC